VRILIVTAVLALSCLSVAQSDPTTTAPQNVDLCELIRHPENHDGQVIRVRGRVNFEFEDFSLDDSECPSEPVSQKRFGGVWLTFGGDQSEIATFCCGTHSRNKGTDFEVAGHKVGLVRDQNFYKFSHAIQAQRLRRPDGKPCGADCKLYKVSATIIGLFTAATDTRGYGHFGWFHLLAMQQFDEVEATRTPVPFGGTFACEKEQWHPGPDEETAIADSLACKNVPHEACTPEVEFELVASHWKECSRNILRIGGYTDADGEYVDDGISKDLLTSYFTRTNPKGKISITRERCQQTVGTSVFPTDSGPIACEQYNLSSANEDAETDRLLEKNDFKAAWARIAKQAQELHSDEDQSWRTQNARGAAWQVLRQQAEQWNVELKTGLRFDECQDSSLDDLPIVMNCNWYSPDGTQSFGVSLLKERPGGPSKEKTRWAIMRIDGEVCRTLSE
jgi:hypothetical protein